MYAPRASGACLALRNCHGLPLCRRGMACHPLPASGPGQIFRSSSGKHSPRRGESMTTAGVGECPAILKRERERRGEVDLSVSQNGKQGELRGFVLAHVPKLSFGVLICCGVLACSTEVRKRIVWPPNKQGGGKKKKKKSAARGGVNARGSH